MSEYNDIGKMLLYFGIILIILGGIFLLNGRYPFISKIPGNVIIHRKNITFFLPLGICILISIILNLIFRIFKH